MFDWFSDSLIRQLFDGLLYVVKLGGGWRVDQGGSRWMKGGSRWMKVDQGWIKGGWRLDERKIKKSDLLINKWANQSVSQSVDFLLNCRTMKKKKKIMHENKIKKTIVIIETDKKCNPLENNKNNNNYKENVKTQTSNK